MMSLPAVTSATWESEVLQAGRLVIVLFQADWCQPCAILAATLDELAVEYADKVKIVSLNVDLHDDIAGTYRISILPTTIFFKGEHKLHETICVVPKAQLKNSIELLQ